MTVTYLGQLGQYQEEGISSHCGCMNVPLLSPLGQPLPTQRSFTSSLGARHTAYTLSEYKGEQAVVHTFILAVVAYLNYINSSAHIYHASTNHTGTFLTYLGVHT